MPCNLHSKPRTANIRQRRTASIVLPGERPVRMYDLPTAGRCGRVNFRVVHPEHLPVPENLVIVCQDGSARRQPHDGIDHPVRVDPDFAPDRAVVLSEGFLPMSLRPRAGSK